MNLISSKGGLREMSTLVMRIQWFLHNYWRNHWIWSVCILVLCPIAVLVLNQHFQIGVWEVWIISFAAIFIAAIVHLVIECGDSTAPPGFDGTMFVLLMGLIFGIVWGFITMAVAWFVDSVITWPQYWIAGDHTSYSFQTWTHLIVMLIMLALGSVLGEGLHYEDDGYVS